MKVKAEYSEHKLSQEDTIKLELFLDIKTKILENKKELSYKNGYVKIAGLNFVYYYKGEKKKKINFAHNSKVINFINKIDKTKMQFFIHDDISLQESLKKSNIKNGILKKEKNPNNDAKEKNKEKINYNSNDSKSSSYSIGELNLKTVLESPFNTIIEESLIKMNKIFSKENFEKRYIFETILDLDFCLKYFDDIYINNKIEYNNTQNNWHIQLHDIFENKYLSLLFVFGCKGIGKTTLILRFLNLEGIHRLYFSIKNMSKLDYKKWQKIMYYETIYIFDTIEEMQEFSTNINQEQFINSYNLISFIFSYIKYIFTFYLKMKKKDRLFIVLDDYDDTLDEEGIIENIIQYINNNKQNIFLCVIGRGEYINNKLYNYYFDKNQTFNAAYWDIAIEDDLVKENDIFKLPLYYYKYQFNNNKENNKYDTEDNHKNIIKESDNNNDNINEFNKKVKYDIIEEFKEIDLNSFLFLSKYLNIETNINNLKDKYKYLPLQFINIEKIKKVDGTFINLKFKLDIYSEIFNQLIKSLLKIENLKNSTLLFEENNKAKIGIDMEQIIVEQLWNNSFNYINFTESNKIKIFQIYDLKNNQTKLNDIDINKPIIIRQTCPIGKYYDLIIIIKQFDKLYAIFIQIGLTKSREQIEIYYNNLEKHYFNYKNGIELLIDNKIYSIGFLLIFQYEKQIQLLNENNQKSGVIFCENYFYDYLIYKDFQLFQNLNAENPINQFIVTKKTLIFDEPRQCTNVDLIKTYFSSFCISLKEENDNESIPILNEKEKNLIFNHIKNEYNTEFEELNFGINLGETKELNNNFGIIDKNNINQIHIFRNNESKYMSINQKIYKINKYSVRKIEKEKDIDALKDKNYDWELYFLKKKRKINNPNDKI